MCSPSRLEYGQFHQYSPPVGLTPELGYHPATIFSPVSALQMSDPKRAEFLTSLMDVDSRKEASSPVGRKEEGNTRVKDENKGDDGKSVNGSECVFVTYCWVVCVCSVGGFFREMLFKWHTSMALRFCHFYQMNVLKLIKKKENLFFYRCL